MSSGDPGDPPATIHERRRLSALIAKAGYQERTVKELAGLTLGERLLDRLSPCQVDDLAELVVRASARSVTDETLAERVERARRRRDQAAGAEELRAWLGAREEVERRAA